MSAMSDKRVKGGPCTYCGAIGEWETCEHHAFQNPKKNVCVFYRNDGTKGCRYNSGMVGYKLKRRADCKTADQLAQDKYQEWLETQEEMVW